MDLITDHMLATGQLELQAERRPLAGWNAAERIAWTVRNAGTTEFHGAIRLQEAFPPALRRPWIMVPGFIYGENRRVGEGARDAAYPRFDASVSSPARMSSRWWDVAVDRVSHALVFGHADGLCWAFAARPHVTLSPGCVSDDWEPQFAVGFGGDGATGYVRFTFPACEEPFTYAGSTQSGPTIRRVRIPAGGSLSGELFRFEFQGVRHDYHRVLKFYYDTIGTEDQPARADAPLALMRDAVHGLVHHHYNGNRNYFVYSRCFDRVSEQIANCRGVTLEWHQMNTGFVSGLPICWGLNLAGWRLDDPEALAVSRRVADRICGEGVSPSGLFWADFRPGVIEERNGRFANGLAPDGKDVWSTGWWREADCVHARTIADACYALANLIASEARHAPDAVSLPLWKKALRGNVEAILALQLPGGSYGAVYNAVQRTVQREEGCGGLLWIPALLQSAAIFADDAALVARIEASVLRAADAYVAAVEDEYIWGAPEDNDSPTSEDGLNAVLAYGDLYRRFRVPRHLELMRRAADWTLSFRKSFNNRYHPLTVIGAYDLRSKGGDYASSSNNHLHVFEVMVTSHLFELSRWTGDDHYRRRAEDHWSFAQQMLCRVDGQFNGFRGALGEQFYWCNWSSFGQDTRALEPDGFKGNWDPGPYHRQKGNLCGYSTLWCVNIIVLGAEMILREQETGNGAIGNE